MTVTEFKKVYAECDGLMLAWNLKETAYYSYIPMEEIDEDVWELITHGNNNFRRRTTNKALLMRHIVVETDMENILNSRGTNKGYKAESWLFGDDWQEEETEERRIVDGIWKGKKVQVKSSYSLGNGTSNSNSF